MAGLSFETASTKRGSHAFPMDWSGDGRVLQWLASALVGIKLGNRC
jgi:hypothetical protein